MIREGAANCGMVLDLEKECVYDREGIVCIAKGQVESTAAMKLIQRRT
jgi:hypothetical protein